MKVIKKIMQSEEFDNLNKTWTLGQIIDNYCPKYFDCMQEYDFECKDDLNAKCLEPEECWYKEIKSQEEG